MPSPAEPTREEVHRWLLSFHAATATLNARSLEPLTTADFELQYANLPLVRGRDAAIEWFQKPFGALDMMTHHIEYFDVVGDKVYQKAMIEYVVKGDDREAGLIRIPAFGVFCMRKMEGEGEEGGIRCYRAETFLDAGEVFGRMGEKGLL